MFVSGTTFSPSNQISTKRSDPAIWWGAPDALILLARVGGPAPDRDGLTVSQRIWRRFTSVALPNGRGAGPVFLARLSGDVTGREDDGCWSIDSAGKLRELIRTGDFLTVSGQTRRLSKIALLNSARGVFGTTRSFNATGLDCAAGNVYGQVGGADAGRYPVEFHGVFP